MYRFLTIIVFSLSIVVGATGTSAAFSWGGDKSLVTINDMVFYPEDFTHWWENWRDKDSPPVAEALDEFIDWHLQALEADTMELYLEPRFQRKLDVFLKVRGLMQLKVEEVNNKLAISDDEMKELYVKDYTPAWTLTVLGFANQEEAEKNLNDLKSEKTTLEEIFEKIADREEGAPIKVDQKIKLFPSTLPEGWLEILEPMSAGRYAGPVFFQGNYLIFKVQEVTPFVQENFEAAKPGLFNTLRKEEQGRLSSDLLTRLKQKFHVQIDDGLLAELDILNPRQELLDKILIKTDKGDFDAAVFVDLMKRNLKRVPVQDLDEEEWKFKKISSINDLLFQNLTAWEAFDRHYEREEPFKWIYQFYRQHRLIKELEVRVFDRDTEPSEEEARQYYQDNIGDYVEPESVRLAIIHGDRELIEKISREVVAGAEFISTVKKYFNKEPDVEELKYDQLEDVVGQTVEKMVVGEVSAPFSVKDKWVMVKLAGRNMKEAVPFEHVKDKIANIIRKQKFDKNRDYYLGLLRERSSIKINQKQWEKLHAELGEQNDS